MPFELENMWQAMKKSHYSRVGDKLADAIRETEDLQEALSAALGTVADAIRAETGTVWFYEKQGSNRIYPRAVHGGSDLSGISLRPGEGIAGQVIQSGKPVIIRDCQADRRWAGRVDEKTGFQTKSMLCVPLTAGTQTFGCIQIINQLNGALFDDRDLDFAAQLGEEIVKLMAEQGLLPGYTAAQPEEQGEAVLDFRKVILNASLKEMDKAIYAMPEFSELLAGRQNEVLQLCRQLRAAFGKKDR